MITSTSVLLFATVALNAMSGLAAPIRVSRREAEAHQVGRRHPQPIAADDLLKARSPAPAPVDPAPVALNRRFPRRVYYERYARGAQDESTVAARAPEPETPAPAPAVAARALRSRKMTSRSEKKARSTTSNIVKKRNSKVGGTLSKKRSTRAAAPAKKRSTKAPAKKRSTKAPAKKRSVRSPSKKRSPKAKTVIAKKRNASKTTLDKKSKVEAAKRNLVTDLPVTTNTDKKRSTTGKTTKRSNNKKRSTKRSNNKKRSNKARNLKKRSPVPATLVTTPDLRSLDVPSENLQARHYKIIKVGGRKKSGCNHKVEEEIPTCPSCCSCSCGCGQANAGNPPVTPPVTPPVAPPVGPVPPVGSAPGVPTPSGTVTDPSAVASGAASSSVPVSTGTTKPAKSIPGGVGAVVPPVVPVPVPDPAVPVPSASGAVTTPPKMKARSNQALKNRSPRISGPGPNRRSSRGPARRR